MFVKYQMDDSRNSYREIIHFVDSGPIPIFRIPCACVYRALIDYVEFVLKYLGFRYSQCLSVWRSWTVCSTRRYLSEHSNNLRTSSGQLIYRIHDSQTILFSDCLNFSSVEPKFQFGEPSDVRTYCHIHRAQAE